MNVDKLVPVGEVHRFQFVLTWRMKNEIKDIGRELGLCMHDTIVFMLEMMYPAMEKYHFMGKEADGKQEKIHWDTKTHIKIDLNLFKRIRLLHTHMNIYSIAIIVRKMIMLFIKHFRKGGLKRLRSLLMRFERIYFRKSSIYDKRNLQAQLSTIASTATRYIFYFNKNFQLIQTKRPG